MGEYKFTPPTEEEMAYARRYGFKPPGGLHERNPYRHVHVPSANWKYVLMAGAPILIGLTIRALYRSMEEEKHVKEHRPEYKAYEYMHIRHAPFPWGDGNHSFFHNPKRNVIPGVGYED